MQVNDVQDEALSNALRDIGLNELEIKVYCATVPVARRARGVAKKANINRTQTYAVLSSLQRKGLVLVFRRNGVKHFRGQTPQSIIEIIETLERKLAANRERLHQLLPVLDAKDAR
jgi:sugar-specific transcriptional regulator TrmB